MELTICWGTEKFFPVKYEGFEVGPIIVKVQLQPNETLEQAYDRVWPQMEALGSKMFLSKRNEFAVRRAAKG